jgi:hypothetical protein
VVPCIHRTNFIALCLNVLLNVRCLIAVPPNTSTL